MIFLRKSGIILTSLTFNRIVAVPEKNMIEIVEAKTRSQMKKFATFPLKLYKGNPYYVPSFTHDERNVKNTKVNFAAVGCDVRCFLAYKDGKLAGRIAGIIVRASNEKFGEKRIRFSRFDFIEDKDVAAALLGAVADFGRENGMTEMHGPWGFNDADREGMLTVGFDMISTYATNYNYEYYPRIMDELGYKKESEWVELKFDISEYDEKYGKVSELVARRSGFKELADHLSVKQIVKIYGDKFFDCYNAAYKDLDCYIEIKGDAKKNVLQQFATVINKDYLSVVVDEKTDKVVAFGVAIPSIGHVLNKHKGATLTSVPGLLKAIKHPVALELTLIGVTPSCRNTGVTAMIMDRMWKNVIKNGVKTVVGNPMLTTNVKILAQWKSVPHEIIKRRQTYITEI